MLTQKGARWGSETQHKRCSTQAFKLPIVNDRNIDSEVVYRPSSIRIVGRKGEVSIVPVFIVPDVNLQRRRIEFAVASRITGEIYLRTNRKGV